MHEVRRQGEAVDGLASGIVDDDAKADAGRQLQRIEVDPEHAQGDGHFAIGARLEIERPNLDLLERVVGLDVGDDLGPNRIRRGVAQSQGNRLTLEHHDAVDRRRQLDADGSGWRIASAFGDHLDIRGRRIQNDRRGVSASAAACGQCHRKCSDDREARGKSVWAHG